VADKQCLYLAVRNL